MRNFSWAAAQSHSQIQSNPIPLRRNHSLLNRKTVLTSSQTRSKASPAPDRLHSPFQPLHRDTSTCPNWEIERLKDLVDIIGKDRRVLDLSCRKKDEKYVIVTDRWQKFSDVSVDEEVLEFQAGYAYEFLVHAVVVEGKK